LKPDPVRTHTTDSPRSIVPSRTPRRTAATVTAPLGSIMSPSTARALATVACLSTGATRGSPFFHDSTMGAQRAACTAVIFGSRSTQPMARSSLKPFQVLTTDMPLAAGCSTRSGARQPSSCAIS
jgi:hypothetical protein